MHPTPTSPRRFLLLIVGLLLVALSWQQVLAARSGLIWQPMTRDGVPLLYVAPADEQPRPTVVVGHGFAGSKQLMLGYAHVLAHAGYRVVLLDFDGHAANPAPLPMTRDAGALQRELAVATDTLLAQPGVELGRLGILGHSMGSGAVLTAAIQQPERYAATVAVSPTGAEVTPELPRALMLQAGSLEGRFIQNARSLLERAGGEGPTRRFVLIPNAEHITILFRDASHRAALDWFNQSLGFDGQSDYRDRRMLWYLAQLVGGLLAWLGVVPMLSLAPAAALTRRGRLIALPVAVLLGVGLLWLLSQGVGTMGTLGGVAVGAGVALWLALAGIARLLLQRHLPRLTAPALLRGLLLGLLLWALFGLLAQQVWMEWMLVPQRLQLWPLLVLGCLPWFLASGVAQAASGPRGRLVWWLVESAAALIGLLLALLVVPAMGFLILLLPTLPVIFGIIGVAGTPLRDPWAYAIGGALFMGWLLAALFPLVG